MPKQITGSTMQPNRGKMKVEQPSGWNPSIHGSLKVPGGGTVNTTDSGTLFRAFAKLKVPKCDFHLGRDAAIELYAAEYSKRSKVGADAAVADWHSNAD